MIPILGLILFVVFALVIVYLLDRIVFELGFITWMIDGHPGSQCSDLNNCVVHKK